MEINSKPLTDPFLVTGEPPKDKEPDHSSVNALANLVSEQWNQVRGRLTSHHDS